MDNYRVLGRKTLWVFILGRIHAAALLLLVTIGFFAIENAEFVTNGPFGNMESIASLAAWCALALFILVALLTFFISWLIYSHYRFLLGDDSLKIKRGILNKEEIAIPYRQIQDVDIERDLAFQMMGLSRIVILTAGREDEKPEGDESEGVLPGMDKDLAEWFQAQLLQKANIQKVIETK